MLVKAIVMPIQHQLGARHEAHRVQIADVIATQLLGAPTLGIRRVARRDQVRQTRYRGQHQQAQRGHALLSIDDVERPVVRRLQYQIAHVMSGVWGLVEQRDQVLPQVIPLVGPPRIIALELRHAITQPIAHELAKRAVGGIEIHRRPLLGR